MITLRNLTKPTTMNELLNTARSNPHVAAKLKAKETNRAIAEIKKQYSTPVPDVVGRVFLAYEITYNRTTSDADNHAACIKPIMDAIVKVGILKDDCFKYIEDDTYYHYVKAKRTEQYVTVHIFFNRQAFLDHITSSIF